MANVEIGTRVYTNLYGRGRGVVVAIHGEQAPETVKSLARGVIMSGGNASFDIVFSDGSESKKLPEAILRGVQWQILEDQGKADAAEIAALLANAACVKAANAAAAEAAAKKYAAEVEALKTAEAYKALTQGDDANSGKLAAHNIRKELKAAFKGVVFSVKKTSYGSLRISWTDGPTDKEVSAIVGKYESGSFDGMTDSYNSNVSPWNKVFGGAQYVFTSRNHSDPLTEKAIAAVFERHALDLEGVEKPTAQTLHQCNAVVRFNAYGLATAIWQEAAEMAA